MNFFIANKNRGVINNIIGNLTLVLLKKQNELNNKLAEANTSQGNRITNKNFIIKYQRIVMQKNRIDWRQL